MTSTKLVVLAIFLLAAVGYGSYSYAYTKGEDAGYDVGVEDGKDELRSEFTATAEEYDVAYEELRQTHNELVNDYNTLYDAAQRYVNTPAPRQSLHCTSYSYGIDNAFTSTNCY